MARHSQNDGGTIRGIWTSSIQRCFFTGSWNPRKKKNKETIHFNADASNTELLYRTIRSTNQLRIFGAVAKWCDDFGLKSDEKHPKIINDKRLKVVQPTEVIALVKAPRTAQPAAGNSLREVQQNFVTFGPEVQFTRICEEAAFIHEVAVGSF